LSQAEVDIEPLTYDEDVRHRTGKAKNMSHREKKPGLKINLNVIIKLKLV
jgi:hypothetical protein